MSRKDLFVVVLLVLLTGGIFLMMESGSPPTQPDKKEAKGPDKGDMAPLFTLDGLDGKRYSLADYRGKIVFLNFWATWCPPCREEMPSMEELHKKLAGEEFQILAVSIDTKGRSVVAPFAKKFGLSFPLLLDPKNEVAGRYGLTGVPETHIIGKDGVIIRKIIGPRKWNAPDWLEAIKKLAQAGS